MKSLTRSLNCSFLFFSLCAGSLLLKAQSPASGGTPRDPAEAQSKRLLLRGSNFIGMQIYNSQHEQVGEVNDFVLDAHTGQLRYLAVNYGGFLGLAQRLFIVPFEAFKRKRDGRHPDRLVLILDVAQQHLEGGGFDTQHWPDFSDQAFLESLDEQYKIQGSARDPDSAPKQATLGNNTNGFGSAQK